MVTRTRHTYRHRNRMGRTNTRRLPVMPPRSTRLPTPATHEPPPIATRTPPRNEPPPIATRTPPRNETPPAHARRRRTPRADHGKHTARRTSPAVTSPANLAADHRAKLDHAAGSHLAAEHGPNPENVTDTKKTRARITGDATNHHPPLLRYPPKKLRTILDNSAPRAVSYLARELGGPKT